MKFGLGAGSHTWRKMSVKERFYAQTMPIPESGCLLWVGTTTRTGYGQFCISRKVLLPHRVAYEWANGQIPNGLDIDHLCRVRACVNPAHLEAVTRATNLNRGIGLSALNHRKTHCNKGHAFDEKNTFHGTRNGRPIRACRICRNWSRRYGK